jgi:hypothetical protein
MPLEPIGCGRFGTSIHLIDLEGITAVEGIRNEGSRPCFVFNYNLEFALQLRKLKENIT